MSLVNKDYFVKGTRWWWYCIFLIMFNIIFPIILEIILGVFFLVDGDDEHLVPFILAIPFIIALVILTIIFLKNILNREQGFSIVMVVVISILYLNLLFFEVGGLASILSYSELGTFSMTLVAAPLGIGPIFLLGNFIISHMYHKKGIIPANKKDKRLTILGISSIVFSLFYPIILIVIIGFFLFVKLISGDSSSPIGTSKKYYCPNCQKIIDKDDKFCKECGCIIDKK